MKFKSFKIVKLCLMIKINFFARNFFSYNFIFNHYRYSSPLNTFMRKKGKDPDPDPYL